MKLVKLNMTTGAVTLESIPQGRLLGGRALIDWYMTEHVSPKVHPLAEGNPFIVAPGLMAGTNAPSSGRLSVGGKSPLTGGIKEANVGGPAAYKLGRLKIRGIIAEGKAKDWQLLRLDSTGAILEPAHDIVELENYDACEKLRARYGERITVIIIGPAGERLYANSTVAGTDLEGRPCRHAARGGVGAIMGAKRLKAIVIDDSHASGNKPANEEAYGLALKEVIKFLKINPYTERLQRFGTPVFVDGDQGRGSIQTRNYSRGTFEKIENINAGKFLELNKTRGGSTGHGCMPGCIVRCSNIFHDSEGKYLTAGLEFETLTMLGSNLGIDDLDAIARMDRKCDDLGIDTIETGAAIAILNEVGLFEFGDAARAMELIEEIGKGTLMGRILGNGTEITAKVHGIARVPVVKGQAIPAHAGRSMKGWGVTYATSPQGADHTSGAVLQNPLSPEGQVEMSRDSQIVNAALDAVGFCHFTFLGPDLIAPIVSAFYGVDWSKSDYVEMGREMLRQERAFNLRAGIGPGADALPDFMKTEPLPPTNAVFDVPDEEIDQFFNF